VPENRLIAVVGGGRETEIQHSLEKRLIQAIPTDLAKPTFAARPLDRVNQSRPMLNSSITLEEVKQYFRSGGQIAHSGRNLREPIGED
jgi:hypothetical protein